MKPLTFLLLALCCFYPCSATDVTQCYECSNSPGSRTCEEFENAGDKSPFTVPCDFTQGLVCWIDVNLEKAHVRSCDFTEDKLHWGCDKRSPNNCQCNRHLCNLDVESAKSQGSRCKMEWHLVVVAVTVFFMQLDGVS